MTTKTEFFDEVLEMVRQIPIDQIIHEVYELPKGWCPFHNDKKAGSFSVMKRGNFYNCFSCGENGDGIDFVEKMENLPFVQAVLKLAIQFEIITLEQLNAFKRGSLITNKINKPPKVYDGIFEDGGASQIATPEKRNKVYSVFSKGNAILDKQRRLSEKHYNILKNKRKLTDEEIERIGFFTMPKRSRMYTQALIEELKKQSDGESSLIEGIPGFYHLTDKKGTTREVFVGHQGIGIPIKNERGQIVGIQIRRDEMKEGESRYIWFSSSFANSEDYENMKNGTGSGSPVHISYPIKNNFPNDIFLTEGVFKSEAISKFSNAIAVSIQGIQNWRNQLEDFINYLEEEKGQPVYRVHFMFDSDLSENIHVYQATKDMYESLKETFENIGFIHYWWDDAFGKGIDDVINSSYTQHIQRLDSKTLTRAYDKLINRLEDETDIDIRQIDKEWLKENFLTEVAPLFKKKR